MPLAKIGQIVASENSRELVLELFCDYQISFRADDATGGSCTGAVKVGVPLSLNKGLTAIDDGQVYDSTVR